MVDKTFGEKIEDVKYYYRVGSYLIPIQFYYSGTIVNKVCQQVEKDHLFQWISLENIEGKMYLKTQAWAVKNI